MAQGYNLQKLKSSLLDRDYQAACLQQILNMAETRSDLPWTHSFLHSRVLTSCKTLISSAAFPRKNGLVRARKQERQVERGLIIAWVQSVRPSLDHRCSIIDAQDFLADSKPLCSELFLNALCGICSVKPYHNLNTFACSDNGLKVEAFSFTALTYFLGEISGQW